MLRRTAIRPSLTAALALVSACRTVQAIDRGPGGYDNGIENATVDGTDNQGPVLPPVGYDCYPHYFVGDGYVYDVHGQYYKEQKGDWSLLRSAPSLVRYQKPEVSREPRCLENPL
jgi:hypothetical protein